MQSIDRSSQRRKCKCSTYPNITRVGGSEGRSERVEVSDQTKMNKPKTKDIYIALNVAHMKPINRLGM